MADYQDTVVDTIINLLKANLPDGYFKKYFYGDPLDIPTSYLPCVMVSKKTTNISQGPTQKDLLQYAIFIQLAYNKRNDFGKSPDEVVGVRALEQYAEGRDPTTGQYSINSVAGILRVNFTMGNIIIDQNLDINYGIVPRPNKLITAECQIKATMKEYVYVPSRT